jgi:uncharacterized protein YdeI (YjbR/CyaY-like superfamily)
MGQRDPRVDAYIEGAADFARPILVKLREAVHAGCPDVEERIKWGMPSFEYKGMLAGMVAFKATVGFGFWKSRLIPGFEETFGAEGAASGMRAKFASVKDLPPKKVLVAFVKEAKRLNDEGIAEPKEATKKKPIEVPADLAAALAKSAAAKKTFAAFSPSHRREYVEWIVEAKREETRAKRIAQAVEWMAEGKSRNWKYQKSTNG